MRPSTTGSRSSSWARSSASRRQRMKRPAARQHRRIRSEARCGQWQRTPDRPARRRTGEAVRCALLEDRDSCSTAIRPGHVGRRCVVEEWDPRQWPTKRIRWRVQVRWARTIVAFVEQREAPGRRTDAMPLQIDLTRLCVEIPETAEHIEHPGRFAGSDHEPSRISPPENASAHRPWITLGALDAGITPRPLLSRRPLAPCTGSEHQHHSQKHHPHANTSNVGSSILSHGARVSGNPDRAWAPLAVPRRVG